MIDWLTGWIPGVVGLIEDWIPISLSNIFEGGSGRKKRAFQHIYDMRYEGRMANAEDI